MRKILHLDLDAFFCAVEELHRPELRGRPFAVGGDPEQRGVIASCSYAARRFGVRSAMPSARAVNLCPELELISSNHRSYSQISRQVMNKLKQYSPLIEQISIDEAFLDMSDDPNDLEESARLLQSTVMDEFQLPSSLGGATNKLVAKIATDYGKSQSKSTGFPNAITIVKPGEEAAFLAPLPVQALWGVGPKTASRLEELGITTIGELAAWQAEDLQRIFGKHGGELAQRALGLDDRPLVSEHSVKSISQETTFSKDVRDGEHLREVIGRLSANVGKRLRKKNQAATTVILKLRWSDFTTLTRQSSFNEPVDQDQEIREIALQLFRKNWKPNQAVRLLGVGVSGLGPPSRQLSLWDQGFGRDRRLQLVMDEIQSRFGEQAIVKGQLNPKEPES